MKLTKVNGECVAKISDDIGKAVCTDPEKLKEIIKKYNIK